MARVRFTMSYAYKGTHKVLEGKTFPMTDWHSQA